MREVAVAGRGMHSLASFDNFLVTGQAHVSIVNVHPVIAPVTVPRFVRRLRGTGRLLSGGAEAFRPGLANRGVEPRRPRVRQCPAKSSGLQVYTGKADAIAVAAIMASYARAAVLRPLRRSEAAT